MAESRRGVANEPDVQKERERPTQPPRRRAIDGLIDRSHVVAVKFSGGLDTLAALQQVFVANA